MYFVKPIVVGEDGLGCIDPDRRDRLPEGKWRAVPENPYWLRLAMMSDVMLTSSEPPISEMEGYVPPEEMPAAAMPDPAARRELRAPDDKSAADKPEAAKPAEGGNS